MIRAAGLAAAGKYVEALAIYDEALEKRPTTVISVDKARAYGLREYVLRPTAELLSQFELEDIETTVRTLQAITDRVNTPLTM